MVKNHLSMKMAIYYVMVDSFDHTDFLRKDIQTEVYWNHSMRKKQNTKKKPTKWVTFNDATFTYSVSLVVGGTSQDLYSLNI